MAAHGREFVGRSSTEMYKDLVRVDAAREVAKTNYQLTKAAEAVSGVAGAHPSEIFPTAEQVRNKSKQPLTPEQLDAVRPIAKSMGVGEKGNRTLADRGISGPHHAVVEGGLPHKIIAEAFLAAGDPNAEEITFSASPKVKFNETQLAAMHATFPKETDPSRFGTTEYDVASYIATHMQGTQAVEPVVHNFGYEVARDGQTTINQEQTGQLQTIGVGNRPDKAIKINLLRVDRHEYEEKGKPKYRAPQTDGVIGLIDAALKQGGDNDTPIGFYTTPTYPSRETATKIAQIKTGRLAGIATAGADYVSSSKGEGLAPSQDAALEKLLPQVPAELGEMALKTQQLEELLSAPIPATV